MKLKVLYRGNKNLDGWMDGWKDGWSDGRQLLSCSLLHRNNEEKILFLELSETCRMKKKNISKHVLLHKTKITHHSLGAKFFRMVTS